MSLVKLHKLLFNNLCYDLIVRGNTIMDKETMELYKLNKPVHFIIKDECFMNHLSVVASTTVNFTFENCKFNEEITIRSAGSVTFKNNTYKNSSRYIFSSAWFLTAECESLKFINDNFTNKYHGTDETKFGMNMKKPHMKMCGFYRFE